MAAPAIAAVAKKLLGSRTAALAGSNPRNTGSLLAKIAILVVAVVLIPALLIGVVLNSSQPSCGTGDTSGTVLPGSYTGPGSLGGVAGTGVTAAEIQRARALGGTKLTAGPYRSTAYAPIAGGVNCGNGCGSTASGIKVNGGARRAYLIASNPRLNQYGALAYIWPNPYGWRGPFVVADTGGDFGGAGRLDFYTFEPGSLSRALAWGNTKIVKVSARPIVGGGPETTDTAPDASPEDAGGTAVVDNPGVGGTAADGSDPAQCDAAAGDLPTGGPAGERAAAIAMKYVGKNARATPFAGFKPSQFFDSWCAWFATNVWRLAGIDIPMSAFSGYPYQWAQTSHPSLLFKTVGNAPKGRTPPVGSVLMYGSGPSGVSTSQHINMVRKVNPDGSFMIIGGNQDGSRVTTYGPCRLIGGANARTTCDSRTVYGIVAPPGDSTTEKTR